MEHLCNDTEGGKPKSVVLYPPKIRQRLMDIETGPLLTTRVMARQHVESNPVITTLVYATPRI
jgi:hypothetical protein